MRYQVNGPVSPKELADLRESVGWNRMEDALAAGLRGSFCHIAAYNGQTLVGYIDCVSNGATDAYIQDLTVRPEYQGRGIGTRLMEDLIAHLTGQGIYMISVIFGEGLTAFYQKFGFTTLRAGQLETYRQE